MQYINVDDKSSREKAVECSIAQGSVSRTFVFPSYINDLSSTCSESKVTMFADDATAINAGGRIYSFLPEDNTKMTSGLTQTT